MKISQKITGFSVVMEEEAVKADVEVVPEALIKRPRQLYGPTVRIKPPIGGHSFYITINNYNGGILVSQWFTYALDSYF